MDHIVMYEGPEQKGLVSFTGREDYLGTKEQASRLAEQMKSTFPNAQYTVYKLTKVEEA